MQLSWHVRCPSCVLKIISYNNQADFLNISHFIFNTIFLKANCKTHHGVLYYSFRLEIENKALAVVKAVQIFNAHMKYEIDAYFNICSNFFS